MFCVQGPNDMVAVVGGEHQMLTKATKLVGQEEGADKPKKTDSTGSSELVNFTDMEVKFDIKKVNDLYKIAVL